jgi:hypothetical protein
VTAATEKALPGSQEFRLPPKVWSGVESKPWREEWNAGDWRTKGEDRSEAGGSVERDRSFRGLSILVMRGSLGEASRNDGVIWRYRTGGT